jgi:hypothetical protein
LPAKAVLSSAQSRSEAAATQQAKNKPAKSQLWLYKVLPALLLAACCWLAVAITDKGLASAYYFKANYYLELWQRRPETLDLNSWQQAADAIETAAKLHPHHPHYLIIQAKINEWAWYKGLKTSVQIIVNEQLYQLAIKLRPTWPDAYADYAYYLGIVNFRVSDALAQLEKAKIYGPFSPTILQRTLLISGKHWRLLNGEQKAQSFKALEQMVKNSSSTYKQAVDISKGYKLTRPFCIYLRLKNTEFNQETNKRINKDFCEV